MAGCQLSKNTTKSQYFHAFNIKILGMICVIKDLITGISLQYG
jgi:hypothetical protein